MGCDSDQAILYRGLWVEKQGQVWRKPNILQMMSFKKMLSFGSEGGILQKYKAY